MQAKIRLLSFALCGLLLAGCGAAAEPTATPSLVPSETPVPSRTDTATPTETPLPSDTPTITLTLTDTLSPTPSNTHTPEPVVALAVRNGNCRVGPGEAYISVSVFDEGDEAIVEGRDYRGDWVWLLPPNFNQRCWVHSGNIEFSGDLQSGAAYVVTTITANSEVPAPSGASSQRNGGTVTFSWNAIPPAPEVGYLVEARQCLNGNLVDFAYATGGTSLTLNDSGDCGGGSFAELRGKNKLGYSTPVRLSYP